MRTVHSTVGSVRASTSSSCIPISDDELSQKKNELEEKQQHTVSNNRMSSRLREKMYIMTLMMSHKESKSSVVVVVVLRKSARKWEKSILPLTPPASSYECYNPLPHFASFIICIRTSICFVLCLSLSRYRT